MKAYIIKWDGNALCGFTIRELAQMFVDKYSYKFPGMQIIELELDTEI